MSEEEMNLSDFSIDGTSLAENPVDEAQEAQESGPEIINEEPNTEAESAQEETFDDDADISAADSYEGEGTI